MSARVAILACVVNLLLLGALFSIFVDKLTASF